MLQLRIRAIKSMTLWWMIDLMLNALTRMIVLVVTIMVFFMNSSLTSKF